MGVQVSATITMNIEYKYLLQNLAFKIIISNSVAITISITIEH